MIPKIFVGTLYCNEGDFVESCRLISMQQNVNITHHIVENMPEKEAHNSLWTAWNSVKDNYNLFIKIDADTVLCNENTISEIWKLFEGNSTLTGVQAPLIDYMTNSFINGLNCFSPKVIFNPSKDNLYCDRGVDVGNTNMLRKGQLPKELEPAGKHCFYANEKQAFHYGVHRALKNQREIIDLVHSAWMKNLDRIRGMALAGAKQVKNGSLLAHNYSDPQFENAYNECLRKYNETQGHSTR